MFSAQAVKRQKTSLRDASTRTNVAETNDYFPGLSKVEYRPDAPLEDSLVYRYYSPGERLHGRPIEDWLRPALSFWHAFRHTRAHNEVGCSEPHFPRSWDDGSQTMDNYKRRLKAAFEFYSKLGVKYWTVWDRDLAPEGETLDETNHNLDEAVEFVIDLQHRYGIKPLWVAANLHYNTRYTDGALTSSEAQVVSYAGAQIKKALEVAQKLGAENFLFRGVREGYSSPLTADHTRHLRTYARLLKMAADYKERLGYRGQLLFEPNYGDSYSYGVNHKSYEGYYGSVHRTYHPYDFDTTSAICFLKHYGLERSYKISSQPGHQFVLTSLYGMLGSVDATYITSPPDLREATLLMKSVIEQGGLQPGGINIGVRLHPDSHDLKDLAASYITTLDTLSHGLRIATKIISEGTFTKHLQQRYLSFHSGFGSRLINGEASLEECEDHVRKQNGEITVPSGRCEHWEALFYRYNEFKA